jgi:hypothetical protein
MGKSKVLIHELQSRAVNQMARKCELCLLHFSFHSNSEALMIEGGFSAGNLYVKPLLRAATSTSRKELVRLRIVSIKTILDGTNEGAQDNTWTMISSSEG